MEIHAKAHMETLFYDDSSAYENYSCTVKLNGPDITIEYEGDDGDLVYYKGQEHGDGHYELASKEVNGKATLHRFKDAKLLEGSWIENGARGMWRIRLED